MNTNGLTPFEMLVFKEVVAEGEGKYKSSPIATMSMDIVLRYRVGMYIESRLAPMYCTTEVYGRSVPHPPATILLCTAYGYMAMQMQYAPDEVLLDRAKMLDHWANTTLYPSYTQFLALSLVPIAEVTDEIMMFLGDEAEAVAKKQIEIGRKEIKDIDIFQNVKILDFVRSARCEHLREDVVAKTMLRRSLDQEVRICK